MCFGRLLAVSVLILAGPGGCEVGPDYRPPRLSLPDHFSPAPQSTTQPATEPVAVDLASWWQTFHDPVLNWLVARGVGANHTVQLAEARVLQARAQLQYSTGALFPTVNALGSYTRIKTSNNLSGAGVTGGASGTTGGPSLFTHGSTNFFQAGFDALWELDLFGGTRRQIESSQASLEAQTEARRAALVTLTSEVANDYVLLRGYQQELRIAQENAQAQRNTLQLQRMKLDVGLATALTVAQSEAQVATTESAIPPLQTSIEQMTQALAVLLVLPPDDLRQQLGTGGTPPVGPEAIPPGLPSELIRRRPDVRQAERQLAASTASIGVATAQWFPQFSLTGSLGLESTQLKSIANSSSIFGAVGPSVTWRIFDAGQIQANIRIQNALQQQALLQYRQSIIQSMADVNNALTAFNREQAHRRLLQTAVEANRRSVELSLRLNKAGVVDFLNVLTAQQSLYQSQDQLAQSEQTVSTDLIALFKALGGGWEGSEQAAVTSADAALGPTK
jgi:NodT family efflux transporter outer membrane factor (OMF) lipoprotein